MTTPVDFAVDTSVAVPLLLRAHSAHALVSQWARGRGLYLLGHAVVETYSVLTRLPGDARLAPADAVRLIDASFHLGSGLKHEASLSPIDAFRELAALDIAGGATYDGMVALAARTAELPLATRDARARGTYETVGVQAATIV